MTKTPGNFAGAPEITADLQPGEYAIVFKPAKLGTCDFSSIYGFYIAGQE